MKIYTKTGDKGQTSLYGGTRVTKNNIRIEAYGTVDELNSFVGSIRSYNQNEKIEQQLQIIQNALFDLGAELATPLDKLMLANGKPRLSCMLKENQIENLENWIDEMDAQLPALTQFILPAGNTASSSAHISRSVCRRAERRVLDLLQESELREITYKYLNRLSDYFFVLARFLCVSDGQKEIPWTPNE